MNGGIEMVYKFETYIHSDIKDVKNTVEEILHNIKDKISENYFFNTKLILNELIINGVLHGNHQDANKLIGINLSLNKSCIIIEVTDEGTGIKYKHKNCGDFDYCESGRGLMIVEGLSDEFAVKGNRVTCIQYLKEL